MLLLYPAKVQCARTSLSRQDQIFIINAKAQFKQTNKQTTKQIIHFIHCAHHFLPFLGHDLVLGYMQIT